MHAAYLGEPFEAARADGFDHFGNTGHGEAGNRHLGGVPQHELVVLAEHGVWRLDDTIKNRAEVRQVVND